jgi:4-diphosphocytidyl-2-C-methyl-D-erythritol kinase
MKVFAPAKINLFLQVTGRRSDGYHELRSLMCCVGVYDTLTLYFGAKDDGIECDHPLVPNDATNLALKAALLFKAELERHTTLTPQKVFIQLKKTIPVGAGLGGGSSDAATVLKALNRYYSQPFDDAQLHALALRLGADVPFFIRQIPALATGIGERLTPFHYLMPLDVLLVYPGFAIATSEVFGSLNLRLTKCEKKLRYFPFNDAGFDVVRHLCNDLEPTVSERYPVVQKIKKELLNQGAMGALLTGSGSTVFGLFASANDSHKAGEVLARQAGWTVFATRLLLAPEDQIF